MSKTLEEMAEEYAKEHHMGGWEYEASIPAWLAGYQAAQHKDKAVNKTHLAWKLAEDYGAVKWLKHKDSKRFGNTSRDYEYTIARDGFYQGYQAAKDQLADVSKVMPQWISVKDRLPEYTPMVLAMCIDGYELAYYGRYGQGWTNTLGTEHLNVTHWHPLPASPKEDR